MENKRAATEQKRYGWAHLFRRLLWLLLIPAGLALPALAKSDPSAVERVYCTAVYPHIVNAVSSVSALFRGSAAEVLLIGGAAAIVIFLVWSLIRLFMRRIRPVRFLHGIVSLGILAGVLLVLFYAMWGLNYYRPSIGTLMGLDVRERPVSELEALCTKLASDANGLRLEVSEDGDGVFYVKEGYRAEFDKLPAAYEALANKLDIIRSRPMPAKAVRLSYQLSYTGIAGMYFPFTAEANVNVDQPPLLLYNAAAHEMAHFQGIAREDEANFTAYLACISSNDPAIRYSGTMSALIYSTNKLYEADPDAFRAVRATFSEGVMRDIADYDEYWNAFEGPVEEFSNNMNDSYLKFNDQEQGVKSYGLMTDLLLAFYGE